MKRSIQMEEHTKTSNINSHRQGNHWTRLRARPDRSSPIRMVMMRGRYTEKINYECNLNKT